MRRFLPKFLTVFAAILGPLSYYCYFVRPSVSGDIGRLGQIPFGKEYQELNAPDYDRSAINSGIVKHVSDTDSISIYPVLTIGDSFSQFYKQGYQWKLSSLLEECIGNFKIDETSPLQVFVSLANSGHFDENQIIIVECVERALTKRLKEIDWGIDFESLPLKFSPEEDKNDVLKDFFLWLIIQFHYKQPISQYPLTQDCFTHPKYSKTLHVYNPDLEWAKYSGSDFDEATRNLALLFSFAQKKRLKLFVLIAPDKYDVYEPWISEAHDPNPTLSYYPDKASLINPAKVLRDSIGRGVKDIYSICDTHWSVRGADMIAGIVFDRINESCTRTP